MEKATLTAAEVSDVLGIAQSTVHQKAREGALPSIKVGDRTLFPALSIRHLADFGKLPSDTAGPDNTARVMLELERKTCEAKIALIDTMLAELDGRSARLHVRTRIRGGVC